MNMTEPRFLDRKSPPHLVTLILLSGVSALSMNIFLPSLPNMTAYFQTDYRLMQLSISVYLAFSAVLQMVIGPLSDRFGRRNILVASLVVFNLATLGTLLAPDVTTFLAFRMLQAAVATAMALSRAIVRDMVDEARAASAKTIPAGRYGTVEEFAKTAAFLVSEPASYITGSLIRCDGGSIRSV